MSPEVLFGAGLLVSEIDVESAEQLGFGKYCGVGTDFSASASEVGFSSLPVVRKRSGVGSLNRLCILGEPDSFEEALGCSTASSSSRRRASSVGSSELFCSPGGTLRSSWADELDGGADINCEFLVSVSANSRSRTLIALFVFGEQDGAAFKGNVAPGNFEIMGIFVAFH